MSGTSTEESEVYNYYLKLSEPTEEDLKRVFSEEELKELCLKHKCEVDIWRWNVVNDYRILFTQSGRYQKWSERDRLRMLAKAVNKIKPNLYKEEEIRSTREEEWKFQLKENILSLNFWKRQRLNEPKTLLTESDEVNPELQLEFEVNTETINTAELLTASQRQALENTPTINKSDIETPTTLAEIRSQLSARNVTKVVEKNIVEASFEEEYLTDQDSEDSLETIMLNDKKPKKSHERLHSDEVAPEIEKMCAINTMSMTIDSGMSTQSQDSGTLQSQDVILSSYDNFQKIVTQTSTQSQSEQS